MPAPVDDSQRVGGIGARLLNEGHPRAGVRHPPRIDGARLGPRELVAHDRVGGKHTRQGGTTTTLCTDVHAELIEVLAGSIRHGIEDDVARRPSGARLKDHTHRIGSVDGEAITNDRVRLAVSKRGVRRLDTQPTVAVTREGGFPESHAFSRRARCRRLPRARQPHPHRRS